MTKNVRRLVLAVLLIGLGWAAGHAQQQRSSDFELRVDAPAGATTITCVRGCKLAWVERGINPNSQPTPTFEYECTAGRCGSGLVGGWLVR